MGTSSLFGKENENKLVQHIQKLQSRGFCPIAYKFAEALQIKHNFNNEKEIAGYDWLNSFLRRNPILTVRKPEGMSLCRAEGMTRDRVNSYFDLLRNVMEENNLFDQPGRLFNMDETGLQLNNSPIHVIATKGSKLVPSITSAERGETITLIACCNAEGNFLRPSCIMKGKYKKLDYESSLPPSGSLYMSQKSAYINADIFLDWLKTMFLPRKPEGKVLLLVDGHSSHCSIEALEFAESNDVILLSLPSHTTHMLQPLDRSVFKALKSAYSTVCNNWLKANPSRKIGRLQFGQLLSEAWGKAASHKNAISGFEATGVYPFNPEEIPEYAFLAESEEIADHPAAATVSLKAEVEVRPPSPVPGTSKELVEFESPYKTVEGSKDITPLKILQKINPVPKVKAVEQARKRSRSVATVVTSPENKADKKQKREQKKKSEERKKLKIKSTGNKKAHKYQRTSKYHDSTSDESYELPVTLNDDSDVEISSENENQCAGCGEEYETTSRKEDWIQCLHCKSWFHEGCSKFESICDRCGKVLAKPKGKK